MRLRLLAVLLLLPLGVLGAQTPTIPAASCCANAEMAQYTSTTLGQATTNLQYVNVSDIAGLREWLRWNIETGCLAAWDLVQHADLSSKERDRAYGVIRLAAVQAERYPVAEWKDNVALQKAFAAALAENPAHAAMLRAKDWKKPF